MKRFLRTALMPVRFLFLNLLPLAVAMKQEYCMPEDHTNVAIPFRLLYGDVCPLINNILSEATYEFQNHCAMKCLQFPLCAGYNFKKKRQKKTPNCQLTHTLDHNFHDCNADDKGWIFYHPVAPRKMNLISVEIEKKNPKLLSNRQECSSYTSLDNQDRNIKYTGGSSAVCDQYISTGWYRFGGDAGTQLPTTCVPRTDTNNLICRTHAVSWLNGAHPSAVDGKVTRTVCYSWGNNCCSWENDIEVINCGFFYIYKLVSPPHCSLRYCGTDV